MPVYVRKVRDLEAHQWDGSVPFRPAPDFTPNIQPEDPSRSPLIYELIVSRFSSYVMKKNCYVIKDGMSNYSIMEKEQFEYMYEVKKNELSV